MFPFLAQLQCPCTGNDLFKFGHKRGPGGELFGLDGFEEFLGAVVGVGAAEGAGGVVVEGLEAFVVADVDLDVVLVDFDIDAFEGTAAVVGEEIKGKRSKFDRDN